MFWYFETFTALHQNNHKKTIPEKAKKKNLLNITWYCSIVNPLTRIFTSFKCSQIKMVSKQCQKLENSDLNQAKI